MKKDNPFQVETICQVYYNNNRYDIPESMYFQLVHLWEQQEQILNTYLVTEEA